MKKAETIKEKATEAATSAAKAAKYVAFLSKKRMEIALEKEKIRRIYTRLGKVYYKDYVTDEEPDEAEYAPLCDSISEHFRRINEIEDEIADAKDEYHNCKKDEDEEPEILALQSGEE